MPKFNSDFFEYLSTHVSEVTSGSLGFVCALSIVAGWLFVGPILDFSENWQLFINTFTTTVTFLMVFLIQRAEKKDALALHIKLNCILQKLGVDESLYDIESRKEELLDKHKKKAHELAKQARSGGGGETQT